MARDFKGTVKDFQRDRLEKALTLLEQFHSFPDGRRCALFAHAFYIENFLRRAKGNLPLWEKLLKRSRSMLFDALSPRSLAEPLSEPESDGEDTPDCLSVQTQAPDFLDLPELFRQLRSTYCSIRRGCPPPQADAGACVHTVLADFLSPLQRKAYGEVRAKVMLTIGTRLPAELSELVFEYTLAGEDLPQGHKSYGGRRDYDGFGVADICGTTQQVKKNDAYREKIWASKRL